MKKKGIDFGGRLKTQRSSISMTLQALAAASGVSSSHLGRIERGLDQLLDLVRVTARAETHPAVLDDPQPVPARQPALLRMELVCPELDDRPVLFGTEHLGLRPPREREAALRTVVPRLQAQKTAMVLAALAEQASHEEPAAAPLAGTAAGEKENK